MEAISLILTDKLTFLPAQILHTHLVNIVIWLLHLKNISEFCGAHK